jgi:hypothetical protein
MDDCEALRGCLPGDRIGVVHAHPGQQSHTSADKSIPMIDLLLDTP